MKSVSRVSKLESYLINRTHGFCPNLQGMKFPLSESLKSHWNLVKALPYEIYSPRLRTYISELPSLRLTDISSYEETELATTLLSMLVSAYYWQGDTPCTFIPSNIGVPFMELSTYLDRKPIFTLVSCEYHNWALKNPQLPFTSENLKSIYTFTGSEDESQFYMISLYIDYLGTPIIHSLLELFNHLKTNQAVKAGQNLQTIKEALLSMRKALDSIFTNVDPYIFYFDFRKYFKNFEKVHFGGADKSFFGVLGASAVQSPVFRTLDIGLGIKSGERLLTDIVMYMKKEHRTFLKDLETLVPPDLRSKVKELGLAEDWNQVIWNLGRFRKKHLKIAEKYILGPSGQADLIGTGGSSFTYFLNRVISETHNSLINS